MPVLEAIAPVDTPRVYRGRHAALDEVDDVVTAMPAPSAEFAELDGLEGDELIEAIAAASGRASLGSVAAKPAPVETPGLFGRQNMGDGLRTAVPVIVGNHQHDPWPVRDGTSVINGLLHIGEASGGKHSALSMTAQSILRELAHIAHVHGTDSSQYGRRLADGQLLLDSTK